MVRKKTTRVAYGRINRRTDGQDTLDLRPFSVDMRELAESRRTETTVQGRQWIASDLELRNDGETMVGVLGYAVVGELREFAEEDFSWLKGRTYLFQGAQPETVVPFAVDLREHRRWVAVATSKVIQHAAFASGLQAVLNAAVQELGFLPADWEVDMVASRSNVLEWVAAHPRVKTFRRIVKFSNPGRNLDDDKADMRALGATVKETEYRAIDGRTLRLQDNPAFLELLEGMERGDVDVWLTAETNGVKDRYSSKDRPDETFVSSFDNLNDGMDEVLKALLVYSARQADVAGIQ